jgi:C-terminal processing protease CtpA/Prc
VYVSHLNPNGAAGRLMELQVGDKVLAVDGKSVVGLGLDNTKALLQQCRDKDVVWAGLG